MATTIYGASDDLIEVEGDIYEEFGSAIDGANYLSFSNGLCVTIEFTQSGVWRIGIVSPGSAGPFDLRAAPAEDEDNYSDRLTFDGDVEWVVCGVDFARRKV